MFFHRGRRGLEGGIASCSVSTWAEVLGHGSVDADCVFLL